MEEVFILLYGLFWALAAVLVAVALIYLIVKRLDDKKNEDFEKRSN